ncbi:MAG: ankyrin repeat domain-containing protein [Erythrobacter sp.]|nr:ankyrin repeat domain-containing protein [Erythrobacter sp.]
MGSRLFRKLGFLAAIASAILVMPAAPPAHAQLYSEGYQFLEAVRERDGDTVTDMLSQPGTQVANTRDITTGETGLHVVTARRDAVWLQFLMRRGANPNIADNEGITPIQLATRLGFVEGVEELIKGGARVNIADRQGETPLIAAVHQRNVELVRTLLAQGADPDRNDNSGRSARDYMELLSSNSLLAREFTLADESRASEGTQRQYGPSF